MGALMRSTGAQVAFEEPDATAILGEHVIKFAAKRPTSINAQVVLSKAFLPNLTDQKLLYEIRRRVAAHRERKVLADGGGRDVGRGTSCRVSPRLYRVPVKSWRWRCAPICSASRRCTSDQEPCTRGRGLNHAQGGAARGHPG
jgi:hypothetical protein